MTPFMSNDPIYSKWVAPAMEDPDLVARVMRLPLFKHCFEI